VPEIARGKHIVAVIEGESLIHTRVAEIDGGQKLTINLDRIG
jgi:hypothetical protein